MFSDVLVVLAGVLGPERSRAALFGVGAGRAGGLSASPMKLAVTQLSGGGILGMLTAWQTSAMAGVGIVSLSFEQAALIVVSALELARAAARRGEGGRQ